ncbi:arsenite efflux transporter metallochaperone ArsD [Kiritimatiellaeota bacterium B1221]|nr:arsenite efflux transporter metallochaperone ArsD [Kiritimatiellaeota bacterium B1221]
MKSLTVYDPPLCCSSGVCGPSVDPELVRVNADFEWAKKQDASVTRFNLAQQPADFAANASVKTLLQTAGQDCLPLVFLDGNLVASRFYPTRAQLAQILGCEVKTANDTESNDCGSGGGCCE